MIRITLLQIALLVAPLILFLVWRGFIRKPAEGNRAPVELLLLTGAVLAIVTLISMVVLNTRAQEFTQDRIWVAPHVVNGEIVPGRFLTQEEADAQRAAEAEQIRAAEEAAAEAEEPAGEQSGAEPSEGEDSGDEPSPDETPTDESR